MKIAAGYVRVSTDEQTEYSPASQIKLIRDYAKRNNMIVPDEFIFVDEGISGRKAEKRPAFMRMISTAKQKPKPFDAILVYSLSRFARNREDSVVYKRMLRKDLGIDVISTSQEFGNDKTSVLIEALLEAMDEYYSIDLGENVKRGMTEKASRGEAVSIPSFGYDIVDGKYMPNPDTAPLVQLIFHKFADEDMGYRDLATMLNDMGIRTRRGGRWENRTVEYLLCNPVYIGKIRWNPSGITDRNFHDPDLLLVDGIHEAIIDQSLWERTQAKIADIKKQYAKYSRKNRAPTFTLQGLVRCSSCGATLTRLSTHSVQCHQYAKGKCNVSHSITIDKLNNLVFKAIELAFQSGEFELIQKSTPNATLERELIERQIAKEKQKLVRVKEAYEAGVDTLEEYKANKQKILASIQQLEEEIPKKNLPPDRKQFAQKHANILKQIQNPKTTEQEKNTLLRTFVDHIIFYRNDCKVTVLFYT